MQGHGGRGRGGRRRGSGRVQAKRWPHVGGTLNQRSTKTVDVTVRGLQQAPGVLGSDLTGASLDCFSSLKNTQLKFLIKLIVQIPSGRQDSGCYGKCVLRLTRDEGRTTPKKRKPTNK